MNEPYFQQLFADRIGGADYGKGTEIYKFEKIKRAKRKALVSTPTVFKCLTIRDDRLEPEIEG